jgi:CubicO group peptidase (beta-lactamase class C family)
MPIEIPVKGRGPMMSTAPIQGQCDPRFTAVPEAFASNFATRGEVGAAVVIYLEGQAVLELWGSYANAARTQPWEQHRVEHRLVHGDSRLSL